jgi:hypothetical protein
VETLEQTEHNCIEREGVLATRLCTHKEDVAKINKEKLDELPGLFTPSFNSSLIKVRLLKNRPVP